MPGKRRKEEAIGVSLSPNSFKVVLLIVEVLIDGIICTALLDFEYSWSLVSGLVCSPWSRQKMAILTTDSKVLHGHGIGTIVLAVDDMDSVKTDVLVMDSQQLGSDLLIGMDLIKMQGGVSISKSGEVIFSRMNTFICDVIKIKESGFSAIFDDRTRVWTPAWKLSGDQLPNNLTGYLNIQCPPTSGRNTSISCRYGCIMDGFFYILCLIPLMTVLQQKKVCPLLNFCELNGHVNGYTAHADIFVQKLRVSKNGLQRFGA